MKLRVGILQERPAGKSTLEQVRALKEAAEGAAATAAADAVAAVQPTLDGAVEAAQEARDEAQDAAVAAAGASIASGSYDAEADALVLTRSSGVEITAPFNGVFTPSILHDYSHGIPLDKLAPAMSPFDKTGTDDVRSKFATGITSAAADGLPILIPVGATLKVTSTEPLVPPSNGIRILGNRGSNAARPVIIHDEASYYDRPNQTNYNNGYTDLFRLDGGGVLDIEGVTLRGSAYTDRSEGNLRLINAQQTHAGVRLRDVVLEYTRAVALWSVGATEIFDTDDTTTQYTIRGGWQVRDPMVPVRITRFRGRYTRDDALHINMVGSAQSGLTFPPGGQDVFVDDVNLFGCNGILFSGVKRGYLGRVRAKLCTNRLVKIGADHSYGAGDTSSLDIVVRDVIGEDLLAPQDAGSRHNWIELYMLRPDADGIPALPEYPDTNGDIVQPYGLYYGRDMTDAPGVPSIPGRGIVIDGFIGRRTLAATAAFTEYGHGMFFNRDGDTDPPITDDALMPDAMLITGGVKDLTVRNSEFEGLRDFVNWDLTNVPTGGVERVMFDQVKARDIRRDPVKFVSGGGNTQDITFRRCDIDGDPLCVHSSRAPAGDGSWQDTGTGCAFQVQNLYGVRLIENHVRNVPRLVSNLGNINESRGNVAYGDFAALGYNTGNKGVGRIVGVENGWRYVIAGSDPSDAPNWKKRLAASPEYSLTTPTHRSVPGTVVLNSAVSDDGVIGWRAVDFAGTWAVMRSGGAVAGTLARADVAAAPKSEGRVWRVGAAAFVAAMGSTAIPDLPDVEPAPWEPVTFQHFRAATDGDDWQPAIMRAQQWSADHGVPVVEPVGLVVDIMQPIEPVSGATVVLPRDFTIRRRFVGGGPGTFMIDDKGAGVSNWHWTGGNLDGGGPDGYPGGIGRFTGTDCTVNSVVAYDYNNNVDASGASMGWLFGGTNVWLRHCDTRVSALGRTQSGTGAYRLNGGTDSGTEGCYGESGDDTFQFVTGSVPAATGFDQSHIRCKHIRPRGKSFTSRAVLAGIGGTQDAQMTCSIIDCLVIDGYFVGTDGRMVNVKNNRSSGLIHGLRFVRCIFDRSQDLSGSTQGSINLVADPTNGGSAAPGSLVLGGIGDVYFEDCRHIGGPTGSAFDIDSGKKLGDGTWLEPTATARIFISGGDWEAPQWGTIDGKVEVHVLKPAKAIVSAGAAAHVVNIGTTYRPNLVDLRLLEIVGVPDGYAGVRVNNAGTVYASRKVSPADGAVTTTGISRSSSGVDHVYLDPDAEITTSIPTSGTMEPIPQLAAALAAIPWRGYTETNNDGTSGYTYGTHGPTIRDISTLTNNRFRNLVTDGPQKVGDVFEISRAGADSGGPWELRVRNGTDTVIAALTVNQWARCVWTGTAWALLSRGSLT